VEVLENWDATGLKALAAAITAGAPHAVVALFSRSTPALVVVARGTAAPIDASTVLKALVGQFGGKGGGKPDLAQGGGLNANADELVTAASALLRG
jgi:alanyl-tRNA synthetase